MQPNVQRQLGPSTITVPFVSVMCVEKIYFYINEQIQKYKWYTYSNPLVHWFPQKGGTPWLCGRIKHSFGSFSNQPNICSINCENLGQDYLLQQPNGRCSECLRNKYFWDCCSVARGPEMTHFSLGMHR